MKFAIIFTIAAVGAKRLDIEDGDELLSIGEALRVRGIDEEDLMKGNLWRKNWPEGVTDAAEGDEFVLNMEGFPKKKKKADGPIRYEWSLDPEVLTTQKTIQDAETKAGKPLSKEIW